MANEELLDVVTESGKIIRTLPRSEIHGNPSLMHRVVHVLVFNGEGGLLLQKRSMNKDVAPGRWDTSVGGHINHGETIEEALRREMEEELGIVVNDKGSLSMPEFLYTYIHSNPYETELVYTFAYTYDGEPLFNREEIDEVRPWSIEEIDKTIGKGVLSDNFEHEFAMYSGLRVSHYSNGKKKITIIPPSPL
ncbi:MAG: NUDIX domain-containing protein [Nitrospirae bacterium]|nr:NUDIX domain-containing protein [Nitrospirota bacterium]